MAEIKLQLEELYTDTPNTDWKTFYSIQGDEWVTKYEIGNVSFQQVGDIQFIQAPDDWAGIYLQPIQNELAYGIFSSASIQ